MSNKILDYIMTGGHPYRKSRRKKEYEEIAELLGESPDKVYMLAHNPRLASFYDSAIIAELTRRGILMRKTKLK